MTFNDLLTQFRNDATSEHDKGDKFERLIQNYLKTDPIYRFEHVWLWKDFPHKDQFGGRDLGIDLVTKSFGNQYWAVQCKFYSEAATIDKAAVDTFLSTSSRSFEDDKKLKRNFAHRLFVATTDRWGANAEETLNNQAISISKIGLDKLANAAVDWAALAENKSGNAARLKPKTLREHQTTALDKTITHLREYDRGKLIMACGTGKTFTSLRIAETQTNNNGLVLFLVPSIALLGQTLREWTAEAQNPIFPICICSDSEITKSKKDNDDTNDTTHDLALPASTNTEQILAQLKTAQERTGEGLTVVFSTYQSIEVVMNAQKTLLDQPDNTNEYGYFDLIICDEAHRTTGVTLKGDDESSFIKVHKNEFIKTKKRIYMTATPRLYSDDTKTKARDADTILCSMDDERIFGEEMYHIGFGEAVERNLLCDYKVLILTLNESHIPEALQNLIADQNNTINTENASQLIGCISALSKQLLGEQQEILDNDPQPMQRAVAFCANIKKSELITKVFSENNKTYRKSLPPELSEKLVRIESKHIDGAMSASKRDTLLNWIKAPLENQTDCRILTNVRCLSEGVDVPSLDAVLFLSPRNSQVDVVQSVGRVMRLAEGKKFGYIIIPVFVPSDITPEDALNDNDRFKVVWSVLNALKSHDDRFQAIVNQIDLNTTKPSNIGVGTPRTGNGNAGAMSAAVGKQLALQFEQLSTIIYAKMVQKVGDRFFWEQWAKDVATIAENYRSRITRLFKESDKYQQAFDAFITGLRRNINPTITDNEGIEMLAQHLITKPVFEALFEDYSFVQSNPVSITMQTMLDLLNEQALEKDTEKLQKFYDSVRKRVKGIDNAQGRQRIIIELYDKFFKTAFPRMVEQLGIVYTPVEVVDFILHSVSDVLKAEFDRNLSDENVHILDPFTGTGTFMTRLLQNNLIDAQNIARKFERELHANEIVLLAYYIAAINIENAYYEIVGTAEGYKSFEGICLTDTFQLGESKTNEDIFSASFPKNSERLIAQKKAPVRIIIGNPPYSVGQGSANDNAQNEKYEHLEKRIASTYVKNSKATNNNSLYDSYIKAFRWASDRIIAADGGIIAFVTNGAWLDGNATAGLRQSLEQEFDKIYVFNLRGNARTSGEQRRKEAGNIFDSGSRTPVAITILIKKGNVTDTSKVSVTFSQKAQIHYNDIGDYHKREEKLRIITQLQSVLNPEMQWQILQPNAENDWIAQRNDAFGSFLPMGDKDDKKNNKTFFLPVYSRGIETARDAWVYNYSKNNVITNIKKMINFYNEQVILFKNAKIIDDKLKVQDFINTDTTKISWSSSLIANIDKFNTIEYDNKSIVKSLYRPFCLQYLYKESKMIHRRGHFHSYFPTSEHQNLVICVSGVGSTKDFSCLITNIIPDLELVSKSQCFPLYYYTEAEAAQLDMFNPEAKAYERHSGISNFMLTQCRSAYGEEVWAEDIFYYVYGALHSPDYRAAFANDLKKMLPRLPLVDTREQFYAFSEAGRALADLHIHYERRQIPEGIQVRYPGSHSDHPNPYYTVEKMRFASKTDRSTIHYNNNISIHNIPAEAYDYQVNGKSAIEWIMERYAVTTHKESGIKNNPNDWATEHANTPYIFNLLLSVIYVSIETQKIVKRLPNLNQTWQAAAKTW